MNHAKATERIPSHDRAVVQTDVGPVKGNVLKGYRLFQGIPYAAAPAGELRWQSPQPVKAWTNLFDATKPGNLCPQESAIYSGVASLTEDCLNLNVTVPNSLDNKKLKPVMVWLHGGGGFNGAGSLYNARRSAVDGDVMVVTINFRLGIFSGFAYDGLQGSGTFGLQDQQAALQWVKRNAAAFGGDPNNVTLFGESIGAVSVAAHLVSPAAKGLFHRAAIQSGFPLMDVPTGTLYPNVPFLFPSLAWMTKEEGKVMGSQAATDLGCNDPKTALLCMRKLPVKALLAKSPQFTRFEFGNNVLPEDPVQALRGGRFHRVPVINGGTRDEARLFVALFFDLAGQPVTERAYPDMLKKAFGAAADKIEVEYSLDDYATPSIAWASVVTDRLWSLRTMQLNEYFAKHVPTYAYEFADRNAPAVTPFPEGFPPGAFHSSELAYQFDIADTAINFSKAQRQLAKQMNRYWANFAHSGNPNDEHSPRWKKFDTNAVIPFVLSLAPGEGGIGPVNYSDEHRLDFWRSIKADDRVAMLNILNKELVHM
ncbi:carboxylesterase family protein [Paenibacillus agilis]|uniref:Carboxylesterase family protein n=2 Tax=Paenibacillus agilis TaxID=3020863 RepID=A0A559J473_9BACL|nr:carboxylesterase family protein [Paenibacillus agilis]